MAHVGKGNHLRVLPFPAGTAVSTRSAAFLQCPALLQRFSNEMQQWLCCGSSCPTKRIVSFPAALGAVDLQLQPLMWLISSKRLSKISAFPFSEIWKINSYFPCWNLMGYLICSLKCHILFNSVRKSRLSLVLLLFNLRKHIERIQSCCFAPLLSSETVMLCH